MPNGCRFRFNDGECFYIAFHSPACTPPTSQRCFSRGRDRGGWARKGGRTGKNLRREGCELQSVHPGVYPRCTSRTPLGEGCSTPVRGASLPIGPCTPWRHRASGTRITWSTRSFRIQSVDRRSPRRAGLTLKGRSKDCRANESGQPFVAPSPIFSLRSGTLLRYSPERWAALIFIFTLPSFMCYRYALFFLFM